MSVVLVSMLKSADVRLIFAYNRLHPPSHYTVAKQGNNTEQ